MPILEQDKPKQLQKPQKGGSTSINKRALNTTWFAVVAGQDWRKIAKISSFSTDDASMDKSLVGGLKS